MKLLSKVKELTIEWLWELYMKLKHRKRPPAEEEDLTEDFILDHSDKRLRKDTMEFYRNRKEDDIVVLARLPNGELVGISACSRDSEFSFTVVHRNHRNKGIATALVSLKRDILASRGRQYECWVARDNKASRRVMAKAGLEKIHEEQRLRGERKYTALKYSN